MSFGLYQPPPVQVLLTFERCGMPELRRFASGTAAADFFTKLERSSDVSKLRIYIGHELTESALATLPNPLN